MNGLYARTETLPESLATAANRKKFSLLYLHAASGYSLAFAESPREPDAMEWVFMDAAGHDRVALFDNALIPPAGERWTHVRAARAAAADAGGWFGNWGKRDESRADAEADEDPKSSFGTTTSQSRVERSSKTQSAADDEYDELPWQLIAVLSEDMLAQLARQQRRHDNLVNRALNCHPPTPPRGAFVVVETSPPEAALAEAARDARSETRGEEDHDAAAGVRRRDARGGFLLNGTTLPPPPRPSRRGRVRTSRFAAAPACAAPAGWTRPRARCATRWRPRPTSRTPCSSPRFIRWTPGSSRTRSKRSSGWRARTRVPGLTALDDARAGAREARRGARRGARARARARGPPRGAGDALSGGATRFCRAWRQTGSCAADGEREEEKDASCSEATRNGQSGFCECSFALRDASAFAEEVATTAFARETLENRGGPSAVDDADAAGGPEDARVLAEANGNATHGARLGCAHGDGPSCAAYCETAWRVATRRVEGLARAMATRLSQASPPLHLEDAEEEDASSRDNASAAATRAVVEAASRLRALAEENADPDADARDQDPRSDGNAADARSAAALKLRFRRRRRRGPERPVPGARPPRGLHGVGAQSRYRRASLSAHPDKPSGSLRAFQRVAEAYQVLGDSEAREAYDLGLGLGEPREDAPGDTTLWEQVEREFFPEVHGWRPFGDPRERKRERQAARARSRAFREQHGEL